MPLNRGNTRDFHRTLYAGMLETVRLLKRGDNQQQGTVVTHVLYECRRSRISRRGQTLEGPWDVTHTTVWHIPRAELERVGVNYLNPLDRIEQLDPPEDGYVWQPESDNDIDVKLFANHVCVACKLVKPAASRVG